MFKLCAVTAAAAGAALAVSLGTAAASASTVPISGAGFANATTSLTNHPDSSAQPPGATWALDNFTRKATVMFAGFAPASDCLGAPAGTMCFRWVGSVTDSGTFTTIPNALGPRLDKEDQALTGSFTGGSMTVTFYTDSLSASAAGVPKAINGPVTDAEATSVWVEQFFPKGAVFGDQLGKWSWSYAMPKGTDRACPKLPAQKWVDDVATGGANVSTSPLVDNVITPSAAHCPA